MRRRCFTPDQLNRELTLLPLQPEEDLRARWRELYQSDPPQRFGREFLARAIAYRLQEQALGALKPAARRRLTRLAQTPVTGLIPPLRPLKIKPGTRLLREWHGQMHEVVVLERGVDYRGSRYRSLSEVARVITGSRWSGPLFFGLKSSEGGA